MKKIDKIQRIDYIKSHHKKQKNPHKSQEELGYMLWQAELNKELMSFWKSMVLGEEEEE